MRNSERTSSIKILFVINRLTKRGAQQQLLNLIKRLPHHINADVFKFSDGDETFHEFISNERMKVLSNAHVGKYNILKAKPLIRCLSKVDYDVLITVGTGAALFFGRLCAILHGIPITYSTLHTFHNLNTKGDEYFEMLNRILNALFPKIPGRRVYKFLPVCDRLSEKIKATLENYSVKTLCNGIPREDIERTLTYKPAEDVKQILAHIAGHPTVAQVGALDGNKNQMFTLACIKALRDIIQDIRYLVIGDGDNRSELTNWVMSNDLTYHVIFTGQLDRIDCLYLMSKSDVLVLTSDSEAFPNVLVEAQGLSIPVVAFDVGGASHIIQNGISGYLIEKGNQELFKKSLIKLLMNRELARKMGEKGRQRVLEKFTIDKKVEELVSIIKGDLYQLRERS